MYRYYTAVNHDACERGIPSRDVRFTTREAAEEYSRFREPHRTPRIHTGLTSNAASIHESFEAYMADMEEK